MSEKVDLHGFAVDSAMARFIEFYNDCLNRGYRGEIEIVHGYGSSGKGGKIKRRLSAYLDANRSKFDDIFVGNPGMTVVIPKDPLAEPVPPIHDAIGRSCKTPTSEQIREAIVRFCKTPKSEQKVLSKFRGRFSDRSIREEIRKMKSRGQLRIVGIDKRLSSELT